MTLQDVIDFLDDEAQKTTLTRRHIERAVLLIHDMAVADVERRQTDAPRHHPFDGTNTWLADMGYATWRMVIAREMPIELRGSVTETLEESRPEVQHAWRAAAAAIRRRVVNWRLPAEEETP